MMRSSSLLLEDYFMTELHFEVQPEYDLSLDDAVILTPSDLTVAVQRGAQENDELKRICQVTIELENSTEKKFPWVFRISLVGFFEVVQNYPSEWIENLVNANAPAILYSAAREKLATASGRSPYPEIILPSVTFIESPPETKAESQKQISEGSKKPTRQAKSDTKKPVSKTIRRTTKK